MSGVNWNDIVYIESDQKLIFVDQQLSAIPDEIVHKYHDRVRKIDLSFNRISTFNGLQMFSHLDELILDNNSLTDNTNIPKILNLKTLSLNNNKIKNLNTLLLRLSSCTPNVEYLSLLGNVACPDQLSEKHTDEDYQYYRIYLINGLKKLNFLDSRKVCDVERSNSSDLFGRGHNNGEISKKQFFLKNNKRKSLTSPLPVNVREAGQHIGEYGKCRYNYVGAQSEGNRYISNKDL